MKRLLLILVPLALASSTSFAQVRIALAGGAHGSTVREENDLPDWDSQKELYKARTGVHLGFLADIQLNRKGSFYFQPGVMYHNKGRKYLYSQDSSVVYDLPAPRPDSIVSTYYNNSREQFVNYIDLPLNLVYKIRIGRTSKFIVGAGPYVSFFYSGKTSNERLVAGVNYSNEESDDLPVGNEPDQYHTIDLGVNALAGFEFGRVFLTANFSRGLTDFYEPSAYQASEYKHQVAGATLGIFLGKQNKPAPADRDKDGVPDASDKCADLPGSVALAGCPDTDGDGVPDPADACPGTAGAPENKGCPWPDKDQDGVTDKDDQCPEMAGPVDNKGCPWPDTDKDGVADKDDQCPAVAGLARYNGCPVPDTDKDGVNDEQDQCPAVPGVVAYNGCPAPIRQEVIDRVSFAARKIQFQLSSAVLTKGSYPILDSIVSILRSEPALRLTIEGHTSSDGKYETNMRLSEERAAAVRNYLVAKGISIDRLSSIGYGPNKPLNDGKTKAAKELNRRVELRLANQ